MGGRKWPAGRWHWAAAGAVSLAVAGAVLANDTDQPRGVVDATSLPTVGNYQPDYGQAVIATPPLNASTVTKTTSAAPPVKTTSTTSAAPPAPREQRDDDEREDEDEDPALTILPVPGLPVYFPNCDFARAVGAAPIYQNQPGYRLALDRNRNGIACER